MLRPTVLTLLATVLLTGALVPQQQGKQRGTPEQRLFDWTDLQFEVEEYSKRRDGLMIWLASSGGGLFLTPSGDGVSSGETFRPLDDFLYLTGLELPNSILAIDVDRERSILFAPRRDLRFSNASRRNDFPGRPLADDPELVRRSGISDVRPFEEFSSFIEEAVASAQLLRINLGRSGGLGPVQPEPIHSWSAEEGLQAYLQAELPAASVSNAFEDVARVRMMKSPAEIAAIRQAAAVTMAGIRTAARHVRDGVDERTLEAELEAEFKRQGAQRLAFGSIIKSGPNSLWPWRVLASHYDRRNRSMYDGELVIFDVGAELDYYASDVGRTFPVSGRFSAEQREILQMEVAVADAIIAAVRPGITLRELQQIGNAAIPVNQREYMQTGLFFGHHIGLSTGDPSLPETPLEPGMVFTVEPWYYNHTTGVAVFTEDDILVTETGSENLTRALPRTPEGLERLMLR